jgi:hypothetical protein
MSSIGFLKSMWMLKDRQDVEQFIEKKFNNYQRRS